MDQRQLDELCVNAIRMLSIDQVEKAGSGHPGMPLGAAPMAYVLWTKIMRYNLANPSWFNRDRFILSAGHGSALLYSLLHLSGYGLSIDDLKNFRQLGSKTPGHPERSPSLGIEATTGPLGQGFAMGVGMAIAERFMSSRYKNSGIYPVDHHTYGIVSDGDLMEGIASEAASLAGHLRLHKLIYLYDDNKISIEGSTNITFTEDVEKRFISYGWHVHTVEDGNDLSAIEASILAAQKTTLPSLICVRTHIGYGSPKQDNAGVHGEPLGKESIAKTKAFFGWPQDEPFSVPEEVTEHFGKIKDRGRKLEDDWNRMMKEYRSAYLEDYTRLIDEIEGNYPKDWERAVSYFDSAKALATRTASGEVLNSLAKEIPNIMGGSADLAPSCKTIIKDGGDCGREENSSRNIHFGVREHAMGAIVNGLSLHGGIIPYASTFLVFSDYMKPAIRLAGLMNTNSIFIFTHDSIGLGEDGPTHQPVEHLMSLRAIPNITVFRPADANETAMGWKVALERKKPFVFALSRQNLPVLDKSKYANMKDASKGAYILSDSDGKPDLILIATGSEVHLALKAKEKMGGNIRVVSMPSWELFEEQPENYRNSVLPPDVEKRISVEAGITLGWERWIGAKGKAIGIDRFGESAPAEMLMQKFGFTEENIKKTADQIFNTK